MPFIIKKKKFNKKVRVSTELGTYIHIYIYTYIHIYIYTYIHIYIQTKAINKEDLFHKN